MHPRPFEVRSKAITQSAKGQSCTLRLPGICLHDSSTVVLCHLPGHIPGAKGDDTHAVFGCRACHDRIDGRGLGRAERYPAMILDAMLRALSETHHRLIEAGLIAVKGWERS